MGERRGKVYYASPESGLLLLSAAAASIDINVQEPVFSFACDRKGMPDHVFKGREVNT